MNHLDQEQVVPLPPPEKERKKNCFACIDNGISICKIPLDFFFDSVFFFHRVLKFKLGNYRVI